MGKLPDVCSAPGLDNVIFPQSSGHEEGGVYNHYWRRANGKEAQALIERVTIEKNSNNNCFPMPVFTCA